MNYCCCCIVVGSVGAGDETEANNEGLGSLEIIKILTKPVQVIAIFHMPDIRRNWVYSRSSRKRPLRKFEKVVVTRAGRLRE